MSTVNHRCRSGGPADARQTDPCTPHPDDRLVWGTAMETSGVGPARMRGRRRVRADSRGGLERRRGGLDQPCVAGDDRRPGSPAVASQPPLDVGRGARREVLEINPASCFEDHREAVHATTVWVTEGDEHETPVAARPDRSHPAGNTADQQSNVHHLMEPSWMASPNPLAVASAKATASAAWASSSTCWFLARHSR